MGVSPESSRNQAALRSLSEGLLRSAGQTGTNGNLLEINHPSAPLFPPVFLHSASERRGLLIRLSQDEDRVGNQRVRCESGQLPFQERVFQTVVLHHIVRDGSEPELREAVRVLARDGVLIILGLNRMGWRYRAQQSTDRLPGMSPLKIKSRLESLEMTMQGFAGAGLGGMNRPVWMHSGFASLGAPLADVVLLQARHADSPEVTPLRFRKSRPGVVQSAALSG